MASKSDLPRNPMQFFWWLRKLLFLWVRAKIIPDEPRPHLGLDTDESGTPICYVLNSSSLSDTLVLDEVCHRTGLPLPHNTRAALNKKGAASYIYLQKIGWVQLHRRSGKRPPTPLSKIVEMAHGDKAMDVKIVPVSIFWGRAPAKTEDSLMKLLFFDEEHAGILQKSFIIAAQGRNCFVQFAKPISLRQVVDEGAGPEETAKKIRRVVRVHFNRQRAAASGPTLPSRHDVIAQLMTTKTIRTAVQDEAKKKKISIERAESRARRYLAEIAADQKPGVVRFFDICLTWLWNRQFQGVEVKHAGRLREIDAGNQIVYLPNHRSHMDYLLLAYTLYYQGMWTPHQAAGINLSFWPLGPLLRRGGGFFLRRSFGGNRLYTAVFNEYIHYLMTKGISANFFIEGGRSRTGRLLQPKTGLLAMTFMSYFKNHERPIKFVPTYLGYDKVLEVRTYQSELRGSKKSAESVAQLLKARKVLRTRFGKAYLGVAETIDLGEFLDRERPTWREETKDLEEKPKWLNPLVNKLAIESLTRVNANAVVSPVGLVALALLATPQRAMAEDDLLFLIENLLLILRAVPYSADVSLPEGDARSVLRHAMEVAKIGRFQHPSGDVIYLEEREGVLLTYYRNNILHLLAIPALVASFFQHNDRLTEATLRDAAARVYPFLKFEFFLRWKDDEVDKVVTGVIDGLIREGLLMRVPETDIIGRPDFTAREFTTLKMLARTLGQTLERFAISTALLARHGDGQPFVRAEFESACQLMAQRVSILSGINEPEFFDKALFKHYVDLLKDMGFAREEEGGKLIIDQRIGDMAETAMKLLSGDIRQSIARAKAPTALPAAHR